MKIRQLGNRVGGALLAFSLLFGIYITSSVTAQAQWPYGQNDQYRRNRDYEREQRRRQRELERQQRREQRRISRSNDGYYGNGGYNNGGYYGNNGYYGGVANNGARYGDGYGNYGGSFELRQTALNAGANEGVKEGRRDRERGEAFNYNDERTYQDALTDYNPRLGDRYVYQQYFRQAFINGYTEGYRGY